MAELFLPGRPFQRLRGMLDDDGQNRPGFVQRLEGLLAGGNPMFDVGIGLLSAQPGGNFGTDLGQAMQFASARQRSALQNQYLREQQERERQESEAKRVAGEQFAALLTELSQGTVAEDGTTTPGRVSPELARLIGITAQGGDIAGAREMLAKGAGLFDDPQESRTSIGQHFDELEIAQREGDVPRAVALQAMIDGELAKARGDDGEDPLTFDDVRAVRNDTVRGSSTFIEAQDAYQRLRAAAARPSPAGDMAIVYSFQRMQDPGSRVTESEFIAAGRAGSLPQRIQAGFNQVFSGKLLEDGMRRDFLKTAAGQFGTYRDQQIRLVDDARKFAERNGLSVEDVVPDYLQPLSLDDVELDDEAPSVGQNFDRAVGRTVSGLLDDEPPAHSRVVGYAPARGHPNVTPGIAVPSGAADFEFDPVSRQLIPAKR